MIYTLKTSFNNETYCPSLEKVVCTLTPRPPLPAQGEIKQTQSESWKINTRHCKHLNNH